jgi:PPOX class probable F420-dependent enzyme
MLASRTKGRTMDTGSDTSRNKESKDAAIFEQQPPLRTLRDEERRHYLAAGTSGVLATIGGTGFPQLSTVIYTWEPEAQVVRVSTRAHRAKARNLADDGHAALFVEGPDRWSFVVAEGHAEVSVPSTEPGDATGRELLAIFSQADAAAEAAFLQTQVDEQRVVIRLHVERLYGDIIELTPPS